MKGNPAGEYRTLMQLEKVSNFYSSVSNGTFKPNFYVFPSYVRMSENSGHYGRILEKDELINGEWESHHLTHDALELIDGKVNLDEYEGAIVVVSGGESLSGRIALATSQDEGLDKHRSGEIHNTILAGIRSFAEPGLTPWRILVHEINHLLGLADLYIYAEDGWWQGNSPGAFGQQGFMRGSSQSDSLAWNRWLLGWIPNSRIKCLSDLKIAMTVSMSAPGVDDKHKEMVIVKLSEHKVLVIETLKEKGFESKSKKNSILVYTVDSWVQPGFGPIHLIPKKGSVTNAPLSPQLTDWERYKEAPILPGQSVTYKDMVIKQNKVIGGKTSISISRNQTN
jgi:M6 family metalloprotease-like protein